MTCESFEAYLRMEIDFFRENRLRQERQLNITVIFASRERNQARDPEDRFRSSVRQITSVEKAVACHKEEV